LYVYFSPPAVTAGEASKGTGARAPAHNTLEIDMVSPPRVENRTNNPRPSKLYTFSADKGSTCVSSD